MAAMTTWSQRWLLQGSDDHHRLTKGAIWHDGLAAHGMPPPPKEPAPSPEEEGGEDDIKQLKNVW